MTDKLGLNGSVNLLGGTMRHIFIRAVGDTVDPPRTEVKAILTDMRAMGTV